MADVRVSLLGGGSLSAGRLSVERLERKSAALLAYLALSGPSVRTRVAGLLWPDSPERTARNNLAQVVRRLRETAGVSVVTGDATVALAPNVEVDVVRLDLAAQRGEHAEAARGLGELLDGYDYDDVPELDRWVASQRERTRRARRRAGAAEAERLERLGRLDEALERTREDVDADPLDEDATRRRMRLLYRTGATSDALRLYAEFEQRLSAELDAIPHEDTEALADAIRVGALVSQRPHLTAKAASPLVGRSAEWEELERAWRAYAAILVVGAPGIGKTRLLHDFAASKGDSTAFGGRHGDVSVPYATCSRVIRELVERFSLALPDALRGELAKIVPALGAPTDRAPSELDKLRLFEAILGALHAAATRGLRLLCFDDLQFVDAASLEALDFVFASLWAEESPSLRVLLAARSSMEPALDARLRRAETAGLLARVKLEPLSTSAVGELLALEPELLERATEIAAISGGNPFYVRQIIEAARSGELAPGLSGERRAAEIVAERLEALSSDAIRFARVAAVASSSFDLDLAASVLGVTALDLVEPMTELEAARIFERDRFSHDLLQEIVLGGIPAAVRSYVHGKIAAHLVARGSEPTAPAEHYLAAGDARAGAPLFVQAGVRAQMLSRLEEALSFLERATNLFEAAGDRSGAFDAAAELRRQVRELGSMERFDSVIARMAALATTPLEVRRLACGRGFLALAGGRSSEASRWASEPIPSGASDMLLVETAQLEIYVALARNELERAEGALERFTDAANRIPAHDVRASPIWHRAQILAQADRHEESIAKYEEVIAYADRHAPQHWARMRFLAFIARSHLALGRGDAAKAAIEEAQRIAPSFSSAARTLREVAGVEAEIALARSELSRAVAAIDLVLDGGEVAARGEARATLALLQHAAGDERAAEATLVLAEAETHDMPHARVAVLLARAVIDGALSKARAAFINAHGSPLDRARLLARNVAKDPREQLAHCRDARAEIVRLGARGYLAEAMARVALAESAIGDGVAALSSTLEAEALAASHPSMGFAPGEVHASLARAVRGAGADARPFEARARAFARSARQALAAHAIA